MRLVNDFILNDEGSNNCRQEKIQCHQNTQAPECCKVDASEGATGGWESICDYKPADSKAKKWWNDDHVCDIFD